MTASTTIKKVLANISVRQLKKRIKLLNTSTSSVVEKFEEFTNSIWIELPFEFRANVALLGSGYFSGYFFRVREITEKLKCQIKNGKINEDELWEPPSFIVNSGRTNELGESYLYVSDPNLDICIAETRLKENDKFLLISYKIITPINVLQIGFKQDFQKLKETLSLNSEELKKVKLITQAIRKNFLKNSDDAYEYSNYIAKLYDTKFKEGWAYPSVQRKEGKNICLKREGTNKLEISTLLTGGYYPSNPSNRYRFYEAIEFIDGEQKIYDAVKDFSSFKKVVDKTFRRDPNFTFDKGFLENIDGNEYLLKHIRK